jgi:hypothetical protein
VSEGQRVLRRWTRPACRRRTWSSSPACPSRPGPHPRPACVPGGPGRPR